MLKQSLLLLLVQNCIPSGAFLAPLPWKNSFSLSASTLSTVDESFKSSADDDSRLGAISMGIDELAKELDGWGRAKVAWDFYSVGVDPALFFDPNYSDGQESEEEIRKLLPSSRRSHLLGKDALEKLASLYSEGRVEGGVASLSLISQSSDLTTKLLLRLADGLEIETVIIPWDGIRSTLCMSTQVGCAQGCTFCATGRMGRLRSLTSDEILSQMFFAKKICRLKGLPEIQNIVFMGLGEASDNAEAVVQATQILTTNELFQLSATKVTVSTVAPTPDAFGLFANAPCVLAWSVHAARDDLRKKLVPTTKYSMKELRQGLIETLLVKPKSFRTVMLEVALMSGVNDSEREADELAEFSRVIIDSVPGCKLIVNLIPYNDIGHHLYQKPTEEALVAFQRRLWAQGIFTHIRRTRGDEESAACGQLATKKRKKKRD